jgi:hypothetical protein
VFIGRGLFHVSELGMYHGNYQSAYPLHLNAEETFEFYRSIFGGQFSIAYLRVEQ